MGKDAPSAPAAPSPAAVTQANDTSALFNAGLEDINQTSPLGSQQFTLNNSNPAAPTMSENTTYAPQVQHLLDTTEGNMNSLATTAGGLMGQIQSQTSQPIDYSKFTPVPGQGDLAQQQTSAFNAQMAQLQPLEQEQTEQEQAQLANQGISVGSQAYNNGMYTVNAAQNNAAQQALTNAQAYAAQADSTSLANRNQEINEAYQQQQAPINQYSALMGNTQVQAPSFTGAPSSSNPSASTPAGGNALEQQYSQQMQAYNSQIASQNSTSQGLFGLGGSLGSAGIMGYALA